MPATSERGFCAVLVEPQQYSLFRVWIVGCVCTRACTVYGARVHVRVCVLHTMAVLYYV